jgi:hypothetical protein
MSIWGSEIFGVTRERNQNEEIIRKQSVEKHVRDENPIGLSEKDRKIVDIWVKITFAIVLLIIVVWFIFTQI